MMGDKMVHFIIAIAENNVYFLNDRFDFIKNETFEKGTC